MIALLQQIPRWVFTVLLLLGCGLTVYKMGKHAETVTVENQLLRDRATTILHTSDSLKQVISRLETEIDSLSQTNQRLQRENTLTRVTIDSLTTLEHQEESNLPKIVPSECAPYVTVIQTCKQRGDSLEALSHRQQEVIGNDVVQLIDAQSALRLAEQSRDSLHTTVTAILHSQECHFLFIKCPSRETTLGIGVTIGILTGHWLLK